MKLAAGGSKYAVVVLRHLPLHISLSEIAFECREGADGVLIVLLLNSSEDSSLREFGIPSLPDLILERA